jgi:hypothetical protein
MMTRKEVRMEVACHRNIPDADAIEFVKRTLNPDPPPPPYESMLQLRTEYALHGNLSRVLFALSGTPARGYATLHSNDGSLDAFLNSPDDYRLYIEQFGTEKPRRTRDAATVAMFLQVARLEANRVGYREENSHSY